MIRVGIFGSGNVAVHLANALIETPGVSFSGIYARNPQKLTDRYDGPVLEQLPELGVCDLIVIAVADDAIAQVAGSLPFSGRLLAHTSGSRPLSELGSRNRQASFYPLQTFSHGRLLDYSKVPICIEAQSESDYGILEQAASFSLDVNRLDTKQRGAMHLSAVFACNFANHMYAIAEEICKRHNVPFSMLHPLIEETAQKALSHSPKSVQTGPAVRGDQKTISAHIDMIDDQRIRDLYRQITQSIRYEAKEL